MIGCSTSSTREHSFELGVFDDQFLNEGLMQGDVNILVDSGGNEKAGMLAIVGRQVGAASAERDRKGERVIIISQITGLRV